MTQPVSSGARWRGADLTCSESSREQSETLTCDDSRDVSCAAERERAHRVATTEPRRDAGPGDAGTDAGADAARDVAHGDEPVPLRIQAPRAAGFCARADTVAEGFLCNDQLIVSNACRKPTNAFDEFVCDEPRMQRLEWAVLRETWSFVKAIALSMVRGKP